MQGTEDAGVLVIENDPPNISRIFGRLFPLGNYRRDWPMRAVRKTENRENAHAAPEIMRNALDIGPIEIAPGAVQLKP